MGSTGTELKGSQDLTGSQELKGSQDLTGSQELKGSQDLKDTLQNDQESDEGSQQYKNGDVAQKTRDISTGTYSFEKSALAPNGDHPKEQTGVDVPIHRCDTCTKEFSKLVNLKKHVSICNRLSDKPRRTSRNIKTNSDRATTNELYQKSLIRPYECSFCNKAFIQRSHLRDHEYIHKGVKPFKCAFCDKTFTQSGNLKTHQRIHTGDKPFACRHCDKAFIQRNHLREHEKIHFEWNRRSSTK